MSQVPEVSVVVGAYNAERYVAEMIESILAQTFTDFEFILVDDGSTDRTATIVRQYAAKDSRLRVVPIPHGGIVDAANTGLHHARAGLIARADADDVAMPTRIERQVQFLREHQDCVAVGARMLLIEPYGSPLAVTEHKLVHEEIDAELLRGSGWALPQPVVMLRREPVMQLGAYRKKYEWSEDLDLFLRLAEVGRLANLPEVLVKYRNHPNSTNHTRADLQKKLSREVIAETYQRRGKTMPNDLVIQLPHHGPRGVRSRNWGWAALKDRNVAGARKHAWDALRNGPFSLETWRLTYCALRGR